ncbi:MAG: four-helix bundle copper-binding protein [Leptothrix sp. (in: b-proteobacteria)]
MNRRNLIQGSVLAATAWAALSAHAAADMAGHANHNMAGPSSALLNLAAATGDCVVRGEACLSHCLMLLGMGQNDMAPCATSVNQLLAACTALQKLALQDSPHTARMAAVVGQICADCEKECRKHEGKHEQCKACAVACAECVKACKQVAA